MLQFVLQLGGSRGGGGEPHRFAYTARGYGTFGTWSPSGYEYSLFSIITGSNPLSKLEVASINFDIIFTCEYVKTADTKYSMMI